MARKAKDEETIFDAAIKLRTVSERDKYLAKACGNDSKLRADVEALIQAHKARSLLDEPAFGTKVTLDTFPITEGPGTVIGHFKLLEKIGEGGMASVYMAEQKKPIRRKVALKIIKLGMDTKEVIARFEAERQALAMMDHPNIAKVFDAGATDTGRPYFVMELVKGVSITEYCDKNDLNTKDRLTLFVSVCNAVQHAHQKGIIHRDIKPTNVMVTLHDGEPVVKVIDFGIAKATNQQLTEKTVFTRYAQMIGTPAYMSPEQAELSGLDIDTRTDIYSLGVLLYELLTGVTPFDAEGLRKAGYGEIQRIIREEEPSKPSTKLSTMGDELTDIAKHRKAKPDALRKLIMGDLDWIVMKSLEKNRTRRYDTTAEFAADIRRHLNHEPVLAVAPSLKYQLRKFVRRNKMLVTSIVAILLVLVVGIAVSTVFAIGQARARTAAQQQLEASNALHDFLRIGMLPTYELAGTEERNAELCDFLDSVSEKLEGNYTDDPLVEASVRNRLQLSYRELGFYDEAEKHADQEYGIRLEQQGPRNTRTQTAMGMLAHIYVFQGRYEKAESLILQALNLSIVPPSSQMNTLGNIYRLQGRHNDAARVMERALRKGQRINGPYARSSLVKANDLAMIHMEQGRYKDAKLLMERVLSVRLKRLDEAHRDTLTSKNNLALLQRLLGNHEDAEALFQETLLMRRKVLGIRHPETLSTMNDLGMLYTEKKSYKKAERLFLDSIEGRCARLGEAHPDTLESINNLLTLYELSGQSSAAEEYALRLANAQMKRRQILEADTSNLPWTGTVSGSMKYDDANDLYTIVGHGIDIWDYYDEFHFAHKKLNGDGSIEARIESTERVHPWAKTGIMIRNTGEPDSAFAAVYVTPEGRLLFQYRLEVGQEAAGIAIDPNSITLPHWIKLSRKGNTFIAKHSENGRQWESLSGVDIAPSTVQIGVGAMDIPMNREVLIGMAVTSHTFPPVTATAEMSNVAVKGDVQLEGEFNRSEDIGL